MKNRAVFFVVIALFLVAYTGISFSQTDIPEIKFEKYTLPNGLDVILHVDNSIPMVSVNMWYHVGSKNEIPGRTGFAHLFEHLMFEGSEHIPNYDIPLERIGGYSNGSTNNDRTNYWENLPSNYLEMGLWLEADRLAYLLPEITQERLDVQRGVVQNERRQGVDNQPYGRAFEIIYKAMYPAEHPYSWPVIGSMEDLTAASMEDVKNFFKTYYSPNNASLSVAGDFDPEVAKEMIEKHFASIPPGSPVDRLKKWKVELSGMTRIDVKDRIELPRVYMVWHSPAEYGPGDADCTILASILSEGKTSRLYKSLVYEKQIAQDLTAFQNSKELGSQFMIIATAAPGHTLEEVEKAVYVELKELLKNGVTDEEVNRVKNNYETRFIRALENVGGFGGKADILNAYNVMLGDPGMIEWDLKRYSSVSPESVQKSAKKYLDMNKSVIVSFHPHGHLTNVEDTLDRTVEPGPLPEPSFTPPEIKNDRLSNGLEIFVYENQKLPLVQVNLLVKSGWTAEPADGLGIASLTAELLDEGTTTMNALEISEAFEDIGATFRTGSSYDESTLSLNVLKKNLNQGLGLMSDVLLNPTFPQEDLERRKQIYLGSIKQNNSQPYYKAVTMFRKLTYGEGHPYTHSPFASWAEKPVSRVTREDLTKYYSENYKPNNAAIIFAGDITMSEAMTAAEEAFGRWKKGNIKSISVPKLNAVKETKIHVIDKQDAPQSAIALGNVGMARKNSDYVAAQVVNNALGGVFTSRINYNLREDKAYTYGAGSRFSALKEAGLFMVATQVQGQYTKESVFEIIKELKDITGDRPLTGKELEDTKKNLINSFPQDFQRISGVANRIQGLVSNGLSTEEWIKYVDRVNAVSDCKSIEIAGKYIHPEALMIVIVGDADTIVPGLKELGLGEIIVHRDSEQ